MLHTVKEKVIHFYPSPNLPPLALFFHPTLNQLEGFGVGMEAGKVENIFHQYIGVSKSFSRLLCSNTPSIDGVLAVLKFFVYPTTQH